MGIGDELRDYGLKCPRCGRKVDAAHGRIEVLYEGLDAAPTRVKERMAAVAAELSTHTLCWECFIDLLEAYSVYLRGGALAKGNES